MFKTKNGESISLIKLSAEEAVALIAPLQPEFANILMFTDLDKFPCYKASYPFGSPIINSGKCYLPLSNGSSIEFNDPDLPDELACDLNYDILTEDPLALILTKYSDLYLPIGNTIMPHAVIHPGEMIGIPRAVNSNADSSLGWNLNAGGRYMFMLSRVTVTPGVKMVH